MLVGAGGTEKTFDWIARSRRRLDHHAARARPRRAGSVAAEKWADAGREGAPRIVALDGKPDPARLAHWATIGVTDVLFGTPDRSADEVLGYLDRLAEGAARLTRAVPR